jgi:hypothetical protein
MGFHLRINEPLKRDSDILNFTYGIPLRANEHLRQGRIVIQLIFIYGISLGINEHFELHVWDSA